MTSPTIITSFLIFAGTLFLKRASSFPPQDLDTCRSHPLWLAPRRVSQDRLLRQGITILDHHESLPVPSCPTLRGGSQRPGSESESESSTALGTWEILKSMWETTEFWDRTHGSPATQPWGMWFPQPEDHPSPHVLHQLSVTHHLDQGLPDSPGPQAKFSLPPPFVNKVLLEYSLYLRVNLWLLLCYDGRTESLCQRLLHKAETSGRKSLLIL